MDKTLYVSDLDGTLLTPREDLSPFTTRVLNRLVEQGMAFTYATARSQHSADVVTRGLTKSLPVIVYNGAFIRRGERRETLLRQLLPGPSVARARQVFGEAGISPLVYTMAQGVERVLWRPEKESPGVARYVASRQRDERLLPVADEEALYQGEVFYFTCIGGREELLPAYEALRQDKALSVLLQEEIYQPGEFWLEVMSAAATKAQAAAWLKERLGCQRMTAFGDGLNDIPLLEEADVRCAVANAVPQLRQAAGQVIPANTLRLYRPQDLEGLIQLFYETVHGVNLGDYSPAEVDAWVPSPESVDRAAWGESLAAHYTVVAEREGQLLGFGDMDSTGYFDRLYVHRDFQGRGVATSIAHALEGFAHGLGAQRVTVHASRTARPFFERRGYRMLYAQQVERRVVLLENFAMELALEGGEGHGSH